MAHFAIFVVLVVNVTVLDQNLAENDGREVEEQHVSVVDVPRSSDFNEEIRKREDLFAFVPSCTEQNTRHSLAVSSHWNNMTLMIYDFGWRAVFFSNE